LRKLQSYTFFFDSAWYVLPADERFVIR